MSEPKAVQITVCSVCGIDWKKHVDRATDIGYDDDYFPLEYSRPVTLEDCVALLKMANQGPPGPPGATGPMGPQGEAR